jgi:hypothetical protein
MMPHSLAPLHESVLQAWTPRMEQCMPLAPPPHLLHP